jgi:hypothetical protein
MEGYEPNNNDGSNGQGGEAYPQGTVDTLLEPVANDSHSSSEINSSDTLSGHKRTRPDLETDPPSPPQASLPVTPTAMPVATVPAAQAVRATTNQVPTQGMFAEAAAAPHLPHIPNAPGGRPFSSNTELLRASKRDTNWDTQYEALVKFADSYGHCNVRTGHNAEGGERDREDRAHINLYAWLALQRRHRKAGKLRNDREDKLQLLVDQGKLIWAGNDSKNEDEDLVQPPPLTPPSWNNYLGALLAFVEDHGHANVPPSHAAFVERRRSMDLGAWVKLQRTGKLTDLQKEKLTILADEGLFHWTAPVGDAGDVPSVSQTVLEEKWNDQFDAVKAYGEKYGHFNITDLGTVLTTSSGARFDMSLWVLCQRSRYMLRSLLPTRLKKLHEMIEKGMFAWMSPEDAETRAKERDKKMKEDDTLWNAWYNVLVWYGRHNGHCNLGAADTVSLPDESEAELGKWLDIQKRYLTKGKMQPDRAEKLRKLVDERKLPLDWISEYPQLNTQQSVLHTLLQSAEMTTSPTVASACPTEAVTETMEV